MKSLLFIALISLFAFKAAFADENIFLLDQKTLIEEAKNNSPTLERIKSIAISSELNQSIFAEKFQPQVEGSYFHYKTNSDSFISFAPAVSPISNYSLGITKNFSTGMDLGIYNVFEKQKFNSFGTFNRNALVVRFGADLYQDIFGRKSRAEIAYLGFESQISDIQKQIDEEVFFVTLDKIYWSLIFNEEAIKISGNLLDLTEKQGADMRNRFNSGIADDADVARQESQIASRKLAILSLKNKKELLIQNLKELLPSIAAKDVALAPYSLKERRVEFYQLINKIKTQKEPPMQYTSYGEIIELLRKSYEQQRKITKKHNDLDLKFYAEYKKYGRAESTNTAIDDTLSDVDNSYETGVKLTIPLGNAKSKTKELKNSLEKANYLVKNQEIIAKIAAYHTQTIKNIELLENALKYQEANVASLSKILKVDEKKYNQARIDLLDVINDQNIYLQKSLEGLEIKLMIVNQVLDYRTVFTKLHP